jgi:mono/diheme cytochrome c family protein
MRKILKWIGIGLGSLFGLLLLTGVVLYFIGNARFHKTYQFTDSNIEIPTDAASIELGRHRAEVLCQGCHGEDLGGVVDWFNAPPLGTIDSANLTSGEGGIGSEYSTEDFIRAIRHGVNKEGKPIFMVAVVSTAYLTDEEVGAIIAYVKSVPPVDRETNASQFTPVAKIMLAAGLLGDLPVEAVSHESSILPILRGVTAEYGEYLVNTNDCRVCHGSDLNGGPFPDPTIKKISPNLTPGGELAFWTEEQFIATIRTGKTPSDYELNNDLMAWKNYRNFYDEELKAIWLYLQSIPELPQYTE